MLDRPSAPQNALDRLEALKERLRSKADELSDAEVQREAAALRGQPRLFRPPAPPVPRR
jgi:hypothetical protein